MSRGSVKRRQVTCEDVKQVQTLIEYCLIQYMSKEEAVQALQNEVEIEADFTKLVWQKLEEENKEFFEPYYKHLKLMEMMKLEKHEEKRHLMALASHPTFDGSHNSRFSSQPNSEFDRSYNPSILLQPNFNLDSTGIGSLPTSNFDESNKLAVLSQLASNLGLRGYETELQSTYDYDESHSPVVLSQPNYEFNRSYNPPVLLQPNSNLGLKEIESQPTFDFDNSHDLAVLSQPSSNMGLSGNGVGLQPTFDFDRSYSSITLSQPNSNLGLTRNGFASDPTFHFDGSRNFPVISQPHSDVAHIPTIPKYPECYYPNEQVQEGLTLTNMQHHGYTNLYDPQTSMHGAVDVSTFGNGNWINDSLSMFSTQGLDMRLKQGINCKMIESRPEYSSFVPLNEEFPFSNGFGNPLN